MNITGVHVTDGKDIVAILGSDGKTWHDPHGGDFSAKERADLFKVLEGKLFWLVLNEGHRAERGFDAHVRVIL